MPSPREGGAASARRPRRRRLRGRSATPTGTTRCSTQAWPADARGRSGRNRRSSSSTARFRGPGRLVEWSPRLCPAGIALWFERVSDAGPRRASAPLPPAPRWPDREALGLRRPAAHTAPDGRAGGGVLLDARLVSRLGEVAEHEPLVSTGLVGERARAPRARRRPPPDRQADRPRQRTGSTATRRTRAARRSSSPPACSDRMPRAIDHAVLAAERDGDAWWVVMRDVSASLLPDGKRLTREEHRRILGRRTGCGRSSGASGFPTSARSTTASSSSPRRSREAERDGLDLLPKQYEAFWEAFAEAVDDDVAEPVLALVDDPAPLVAALDARGTTLIHADIRDEQIGLDGDRLVLLDWGRASQGHPVVDFFWSICHNAWRIDASHDELVEDFRRARGERDDPRAVDLGVIAGLVMYGWVFGHSAAYHPDPAERDWARARAGLVGTTGATGARDLVARLTACRRVRLRLRRDPQHLSFADPVALVGHVEHVVGPDGDRRRMRQLVGHQRARSVRTDSRQASGATYEFHPSTREPTADAPRGVDRPLRERFGVGTGTPDAAIAADCGLRVLTGVYRRCPGPPCAATARAEAARRVRPHRAAGPEEATCFDGATSSRPQRSWPFARRPRPHGRPSAPFSSPIRVIRSPRTRSIT